MVVREAVANRIYIATQNRMRQLVTLRAHLPATEEELLLMLRCRYTVKHNRQITAGRILHAYRNAHTASNHTMQLVFTGTRAHSSIA